MAYRLTEAMTTDKPESPLVSLLEVAAGATLCTTAWLLPLSQQVGHSPGEFLTVPHGGYGYWASLVVLLSTLKMAWRLEGFWRNLEPSRRWEYKFLVAGSVLCCAALVWSSSYRLTYLRIWGNHLFLLASLLLPSWLMMVYAIGRHKLLNRKLFVSRKVVHASVAPLAFGGYLLGLGAVSLLTRRYGWSFPYVLFWFLFGIGFTGVSLYFLSGTLRKRVHHFISTHFYVNKYEYRDEWLSLSHLLRGAFTESEIVNALGQVLSESLYSKDLYVWTGDEGEGYSVLFPDLKSPQAGTSFNLPKGDPIVSFLKMHERYYVQRLDKDALIHEGGGQSADRLAQLGIVLLMPILAGEEMLGIIGLGEEFTGGSYGQDDFDLLSAVASQTAAAIKAARMSEELARVGRKEAFDSLSAFVLHDIKNAASMLSLMRKNAETFMNDPEFQADLLETVDDALKRMKKVQRHLSSMKDAADTNLNPLELCSFLMSFAEETAHKLTNLRMFVDCPAPLTIPIDSELLGNVLENLLLNSLEAGGQGTEVSLSARLQEGIVILELADNGPGIPRALLPRELFEPFRSSKESGTGIGLWQASKILESLHGTISASNLAAGGALFRITLPTCLQESSVHVED
jgi:putative PEP-CTERM system histidine kinase